MNMHAFRQKEIDRPETINWTPVNVPVGEATEKAATHILKGMTVQYLLRPVHRIGKTVTSTLFFLTLGATGLWTVVDLAKLVIEWWKKK